MPPLSDNVCSTDAATCMHTGMRTEVAQCALMSTEAAIRSNLQHADSSGWLCRPGDWPMVWSLLPQGLARQRHALRPLCSMLRQFLWKAWQVTAADAGLLQLVPCRAAAQRPSARLP